MEMYVPFVVYMAICIIAIALVTSRKARCLFVAVILAAVVFAGVLSLHGAARAEEIPAIRVLRAGDYETEAVFADGDVVTEITFSYNENSLKFYWLGKLQTWRPIWVSIIGTETLNGGYVAEE